MIKYMMLLIIAGTCLMGCKKSFNGTIPAESYFDTQNVADDYYFEGQLDLTGSQEPIFIKYGTNSEASFIGNENSFLIYNDSVYSELYSAWAQGFFAIIPYAGNGYNYTDHYMTKFGYLYSHVQAKGISFCFFHPDGNARWDEATIDTHFQEGKSFEFGFEPGQVEVAYFKNNDILNEAKNNGLLTTPASNVDGYLRIEKVIKTIAYSAANNLTNNGIQITVSFKCNLYKQYTEKDAGIIQGETTLFIPIEE